MLTGTWPIFAVNANRSLPVNSRPNKGLALLGLTGLIAFLVIMLVVIVVMASWVRKTGKEKLTRSTLESLASALMVYSQATGQFPPTVSSNAQLLDYLNSVPQARQAADAMPPYVFRTSEAGKEILDGWTRPLTYVFDPASARPELISKGPDPADPTDDIYAQGLRPMILSGLPNQQPQ
jgi:type II secretory pathway pseudopilin PulG